MTSRPVRVLRGLVAAGVAVFVAALSHVAGGGGAPGTVGLLLALAFSSVLCVGLAGRSLSIIRLCLSVGLSQLALHALFGVGASVGAGMDAAALQMGGMGHHGSTLLTIASTAQAATAGTGAPASLDTAASLAAVQLCSWMWVAHAVAAVVTVVALRRGETAFWGLVALAGRRFRRLVRPLFVEPTPVVRPDRVGVARRPDHPLDLLVLLGGLRHRGPPVCVRFAL